MFHNQNQNHFTSRKTDGTCCSCNVQNHTPRAVSTHCSRHCLAARRGIYSPRTSKTTSTQFFHLLSAMQQKEPPRLSFFWNTDCGHCCRAKRGACVRGRTTTIKVKANITAELKISSHNCCNHLSRSSRGSAAGHAA